MQKLPPSEFRFGNYGAGIPFETYMNKNLLISLMTELAVGYCPNPEYRTLTGQVAVMFELGNFGRYWSHIPDYIFIEYIERSAPSSEIGEYRK